MIQILCSTLDGSDQGKRNQTVVIDQDFQCTASGVIPTQDNLQDKTT